MFPYTKTSLHRCGVSWGGKSHLWRGALSHHCLQSRSALPSGDLLKIRKMGNSAKSAITAKKEFIMIKKLQRASLEVNLGLGAA